MPGKRGSSSFIAAHLASPRLSPSPSAASELAALLLRRVDHSPDQRRRPERFFFLRGEGGGLRAGARRCRRRRSAFALPLRASASARACGAGPCRDSSPPTAAPPPSTGFPRAGLRPRPVVARRDGVRLRVELADDQLLADRPDVRRDPVDDQAGLEVDDEETKTNGSAYMMRFWFGSPLTIVTMLAASCVPDVEHDQHAQQRPGPSTFSARSAIGPKPALPRDVRLELGRAQQVEERDEERDLQQQREAGGQRVDLLAPGRSPSSPGSCAACRPCSAPGSS